MTQKNLNGLLVRFQQAAPVPSVRQGRNLRFQRRSYGRLQTGCGKRWADWPVRLPGRAFMDSACGIDEKQNGPRGPVLAVSMEGDIHKMP